MKRVVCLLLTLALMLGMAISMTSCGESGAKDLEEVKAKGKIVVGMECTYAPYNWAQAKANDYTVPLSNGMYADGFDVQIAKRIAESLGVALEIVPIGWDGLIPAVESKQIDLIIAGMSPTEERKLSIDFTDVYLNSNLVMVVRKDSTYANATKIADFAGAKITGQLNTFHYKVIDQIAGVNKQPELEDFPALIQSLAGGAIDGYVCEKPGAISAVASNPEFTYIEFSTGNGFTYDSAEASIAVGLRKGSSLTAEINKLLATIPQSEREAMMADAISRQPAGEE